ncbi:regulator of G-protein signaling 9-binding protein isoform X2 [Betta splendens]|uniref:Regulator of G-protein signaling 9-binding protein isoform X2 n=1 Tax=Betta splendens TaxID=158456 RepID=A0A6P7MLM2_BETSP|nr:regulator of G-protein signaling 9-binding protein isoform X2 [Betta splendens]
MEADSQQRECRTLLPHSDSTPPSPHAFDHIMSRWRRSVDGLTALRRNQWDCERAQEALSHVMSCFHQLAALLGSSADGAFLRNELEGIRALAYRICSGADDQQLSERLWVLFLSAAENLLSDLWKASDLIGRFPLTQPKDRHALVSTGCIDGPVGMAARVVLVQVPWVTLEEAPSPDLTSHITDLQTMLNEMQLKVPVAFWSVEATQPAWAEAHEDLDQPEESLEELMEVEVVSENKTMSACCRLHCVRSGIKEGPRKIQKALRRNI